MSAFKNIMWLTVYPPSPSASFLWHSDIRAALAIKQDIERDFKKRIECLPLPWVSGGALQKCPAVSSSRMRSNSPAGKRKLLLERIFYDKNGWDQKTDSSYVTHTSKLAHKVKGMHEWRRKRVERCLGAEYITYMVPFNLHHGYIHWPIFYPWNTQSPEALLLCLQSDRQWGAEPGWELGTGLMAKDMLCVYHITLIPKLVGQQQSDQEGFDCTAVNTKFVISLQTQRELEEFFLFYYIEKNDRDDSCDSMDLKFKVIEMLVRGCQRLK